MSDESTIHDTWSGYWQNKSGQLPPWDSLSEVVLHCILGEVGDPAGQQIMEAGCGTGRISLRIAQSGAQVTCLDIASEALVIARDGFNDMADRARFVQGSILDLPQDMSYDVVWNAGVMEHFQPKDQQKAISQFIDVLQPSGKVVLLTPYARSIPYRCVKYALERAGRWPFGREEPITTLRPVVPRSGRLVNEYTVSFLPFFLDSYKFVPLLSRPCRWLSMAQSRVLGAKGFAWLDRIMSRFLGGYLLVSVLERRDDRVERER